MWMSIAERIEKNGNEFHLRAWYSDIVQTGMGTEFPLYVLNRMWDNLIKRWSGEDE